MDAISPDKTEISGLAVWNKKFEGNKIPGSTRVPVQEIAEHFHGQTKGLVGLDLGSGSGRSTQELSQQLGCRVDAMDLSYGGLRGTDTNVRIQAGAENLPIKEEAYDFVNLCGVLTNIVNEDPEKAVEMRKRVVEEAKRVIKPGGIIVVSDFSSDHSLTDYPVNYKNHQLITHEFGTIAVFRPEAKVTFRDKTPEEIASLKNSPDLVRYAHHYDPKEITGMFRGGGFNVSKISSEIGSTPSGTPIENLVMVAVKPAVVQV